MLKVYRDYMHPRFYGHYKKEIRPEDITGRHKEVDGHMYIEIIYGYECYILKFWKDPYPVYTWINEDEIHFVEENIFDCRETDADD